MTWRALILGGLFALHCATVSAQQPAPPVAPLPTAPVGAATSTQAEYILGPEDVIEIEVVGQPGKNSARVYADGTVQLNLVGKLTAQGKTPRQLGEEIAATLRAGGFFSDPVVNVEVVNYASRYVTVLGAVATPSLVPMNRTYRLSEVVARVGGVRADAADYLVVRSESGTENRYPVDQLATGGDAKDPIVLPGDKIFAPVAEVFYISGQVNSPGAFPMRTGLTIQQAIARAGGLTASGSDKKVRVTRKGEKMKLAGDAEVQPGDVLVVGERLF